MKKLNLISIAGSLLVLSLIGLSACDNQLLNTADSMVVGLDEIQVKNENEEGPADPSLIITAPGENSTFEFDPNVGILNIPVKVLGTRSLGSGANENVCGLRLFELTAVDEDDETTLIAEGAGGQKRFQLSADGCPSSLEKTFEWVIDDEDQLGTYTIKAKAVAGTGDNAVDVDADVVENVSIIELTVDYPAAPSVASSLLKDAEIAARWGNRRNGGNYISEVAQNMEEGATFNGVEKDDWEDYRCEVATFLNGRFSETGETGTVDTAACTVD